MPRPGTAAVTMDRSMSNSPFRSEPSSWQSPADVRAAVQDALRRGEAAIVVTSGPASGKTALARELATGTDDLSFSTGLFDASLEPDAVLRQLLTDFGLSAGKAAEGTVQQRETLTAAVAKFLRSLKPLGAHAVIVVDDADKVGIDVLSVLIRLAREAGVDGAPLRLVLVGQIPLEGRLQEPPLSEWPVPSVPWRHFSFGIDDALVPVLPPEAPFVSVPEPEPEPVAAAAPTSRLLPLLVGLLVVVGAAGYYYTRSTDTPASGAPAAAAPATAPPAAAPAPAPAPPQAAPTATAPAATAPSPSTSSPAAVAPGAPGTPTAGAPAAATPAATSGSVPGSGQYRITVASFRTAGKAEQISDALRQQQLAVTTRVDATGTWHQVFAGPYPTIEAARDAQRQLERAGFPETQIALLPAAR